MTKVGSLKIMEINVNYVKELSGHTGTGGNDGKYYALTVISRKRIPSSFSGPRTMVKSAGKWYRLYKWRN